VKPPAASTSSASSAAAVTAVSQLSDVISTCEKHHLRSSLSSLSAVAAGRGGAKGDVRLGRHCKGAAFRGAKIWNSEILHPPTLRTFTVHTNTIVVTIRIIIGDLIAGVGAATKTFASGVKHPPAATALSEAGFILFVCVCLFFSQN